MNQTDFAIEYLKSSLSLNTVIGCPLGCAYCSVAEFSEEKMQTVHSPQELVDRLKNHPLFILDKTPLTINNRSDPLWGPVKSDTFEVMRLLDKNGITNPKVIISKCYLSPEDLGFLEDISGQNYVIVTHSGLPTRFERYSNQNQLRSLETLQKRRRVKSLHYWRPLIKGVNDDPSILMNILLSVQGGCDGSILFGLRLNEGIRERIIPLGADLSGWDGDTKHKYLPPEIVERILEIRDREFPEYPLFRHTSCGLSASIGKPDYNFHFLSKRCLPNCPSSEYCKVGLPPLVDTVEAILGRLGISSPWEYGDSKLFIRGEVGEEQRSCLSHSLNYPVDCLTLTRSPSEVVLRR